MTAGSYKPSAGGGCLLGGFCSGFRGRGSFRFFFGGRCFFFQFAGGCFLCCLQRSCGCIGFSQFFFPRFNNFLQTFPFQFRDFNLSFISNRRSLNQTKSEFPPAGRRVNWVVSPSRQGVLHLVVNRLQTFAVHGGLPFAAGIEDFNYFGEFLFENIPIPWR